MSSLTRQLGSSKAQEEDERRDHVVDELRAIRRDLAGLRKILDDFAGAYLNARFPYGKPSDRWARR